MSEKLAWGVVGTMDEPAPLILAWAAHYLSLGAAEVHVFLDRETPEVSRQLDGVPGVFVTVCDDAYWRHCERGRRPPRHTGRQKFNATRVYRTRPLDWLLHCDADEFLYPMGDFTGELAASRARSVRLRNAERVRRGPPKTLFEGSFRLRCTDETRVRETYGKWADFLRDGLSGYRQGKDIVRCGLDLKMGIHFPIEADTGRQLGNPEQTSETAVLLHFDGLTPLHVLSKLLKRAHEPEFNPPRNHGAQRVRQFSFVREHASRPRRLKRLLENVFALTEERAARLGDAHVELPFDPAGAIKALGLAADLGTESFDAELRKREADLFEKAGLRF